MRTVTRSTKFKKEFLLAEKRNKDMAKIIDIMGLLENEMPLPPSCHEHSLRGNFKDTLECHIEPDWLLIYEIDDTAKTVFFKRTGTHADLFS
jgi:mRNA interferase YafQ